MPLKVDQNDRISVDGRKQWKTDQIRMKTMNENIAGACVYSMRIEFNLRHKHGTKKRIYRTSKVKSNGW